jgi:hypothetical protein
MYTPIRGATLSSRNIMIIIDDIDDQYLNWRIIMDYPINVGKTMINHPFGNGL